MTDEIKQHVARLREDANRNIATGEHSESDYGVLAVCTALEQAEADGTEYVKEIRDLTIRCQQAEAALQGRTVSCVCGGDRAKRDAEVLEWAANRMASLALHDLVEPIRRGEVVIS